MAEVQHLGRTGRWTINTVVYANTEFVVVRRNGAPVLELSKFYLVYLVKCIDAGQALVPPILCEPLVSAAYEMVVPWARQQWPGYFAMAKG
jgi:hypothetical protein